MNMIEFVKCSKCGQELTFEMDNPHSSGCSVALVPPCPVCLHNAYNEGWADYEGDDEYEEYDDEDDDYDDEDDDWDDSDYIYDDDEDDDEPIPE